MGPTVLLLPPQKVVLQIFMTLKNPLLLAGFEPVNLGSNSKHDNHYTTKNDIRNVKHHNTVGTWNPVPEV
jgi:hypothetical protein